MMARLVVKFGVLLLLASCISSIADAKNVNWESRNGGIFANGKRFRIKGISWFGMETNLRIPHGLWARSADDLLQFIADNGFNAVRLPLSVEAVLGNLRPPSGQGLDTYQNADLVGLGTMDVLDRIVKKAAAKNLLIQLDFHRHTAAQKVPPALWYNGKYTEAKVNEFWDKLASKFCGQWNVFSADLKNEPRAPATWGTGGGNDWRLAAQRLGNRILSKCPRWLTFIQGLDGPGYFWGSNLQGIKSAPIQLRDNSKLVYAVHIYGPSVYMQPYFKGGDFPGNLEGIWNSQFGWIRGQSGKALVVGEWGGTYDQNMKKHPRDKAWFETFVNFLASNGYDSFFWCLNPDSGDTGGLLKNDWRTPESSKLAQLGKLPATSVASI